MGTKNNPGEFDCYHVALPDEPMFTLLARDPDFYRLVWSWVESRQHAINCGERPDTDQRMIIEAGSVAVQGARWRRENNGIWRKTRLVTKLDTGDKATMYHAGTDSFYDVTVTRPLSRTEALSP